MRPIVAFGLAVAASCAVLLRAGLAHAAPEKPLEWNVVLSGSGAAAEDYAFDAPGAGVVSVTVWGTGPSGDLVLSLVDAQGTSLVREDEDLGGERHREFLTAAVPAAGRYVVRVEPFGSGSGTAYSMVAHWVDAPAPAEGVAASEAEARAALEAACARFRSAESFRTRVEGGVPGEMSLTGAGAYRAGRFRGELAIGGERRGRREEEFLTAWDGRTLWAEERRGDERRDVDHEEPPGGEISGRWVATCDEDVAMPAMVVFPHLLLEMLAYGFVLSANATAEGTIVSARPRGTERHEDLLQMSFRVEIGSDGVLRQIAWTQGRRETLTTRHWFEWDAPVSEADVAYQPPTEEEREGGVSGREAAAIGSLRTLSTAQAIFREMDREGDGVMDYGTLQELASGQLIDAELGSGRKQGYTFEIARADQHRWAARANPEQPGGRWFFIDESGVIRASTTGPADENSPPIQ